MFPSLKDFLGHHVPTINEYNNKLVVDFKEISIDVS